jgi:hypothetical protein
MAVISFRSSLTRLKILETGLAVTLILVFYKELKMDGQDIPPAKTAKTDPLLNNLEEE